MEPVQNNNSAVRVRLRRTVACSVAADFSYGTRTHDSKLRQLPANIPTQLQRIRDRLRVSYLPV